MIGGAPFWRDGDQRRPPLPSLQPVTERPTWVSPSKVINCVCAIYQIEDAAFFAHRRATELVEARAMVVWLLRSVPVAPTSYPKIGRAIDRHHTDAMHLHRMAIGLRLSDARFKRVAEATRFHFQVSETDHARN